LLDTISVSALAEKFLKRSEKNLLKRLSAEDRDRARREDRWKAQEERTRHAPLTTPPPPLRSSGDRGALSNRDRDPNMTIPSPVPMAVASHLLSTNSGVPTTPQRLFPFHSYDDSFVKAPHHLVRLSVASRTARASKHGAV